VFVRSTIIDPEELDDVLGLSKLVDDRLNQVSDKGSVSSIVFLDIREFPEAYKLTGTYSQQNGMIELKLKLKGPVNKELLLKSDNKEDLVEQIIELIETIE
jgi:hypothetical protein